MPALPSCPPPRRAVGRLAIVSAALSCLAVATGCDDPKRTQCVALVDAINPHTAQLSRAVEHLADAQSNAKVIGELRAAVDEADKAVRSVQLEDTTLSKLALRYRKQLQAAVSVADDLEAAGKDPTRLAAGVEAADGFLAQRDAILGDLNEYCASES